MKPLFSIYAGHFGSIALLSSPGIALVEDRPPATGCLTSVMQSPSIETQNEFIRARADWSDLVLQSISGYRGTGSKTEADRVWYETASFTLTDQSKKQPVKMTELLDVASVVAEVRSSLSLQIKELAEILGVQRPTVYSWLEGDQKPQDQNRRRLLELLKVARIWTQISDQPVGKTIRTQLNESGLSLLDQLKREAISLYEVEEHMRAIADLSAATQKKKSVLDLAKENGFDLSGVRDQREVVDAMTGKRMHED